MKLGMIGTGRIAKRALREISFVPDIEEMFIYNPHGKSARQFAESYGLSHWTDSLSELTSKTEAVYIASPHETHYEYARYFLSAGKHVLCEKPMTLSGKQAEELYHLADEKRLVLMEALKTAWCPGFQEIERTATSGIIGEIREVDATFTRLTPTNTRECQDLQYGGSFTEFGSYVLLPILHLLGTGYTAAEFHSVPAANGLDSYTKLFLRYQNQCGVDVAYAEAKTGLSVKSEGQLLISGTKGYILVPSPWWQTRYFEVRFENPNHVEKHYCEFEGDGLRYEFQHFVKQVQYREKEGQKPAQEIGCMGFEKERKIRKETIARADLINKFLLDTGRNLSPFTLAERSG
jgi:predicted dehydrogenase